MDEHNIIKARNYISQGTTIKEISRKKNMQTYGKFWYNILPKNIPVELITEYIKDPRGTIAKNRFTDNEIKELRQPQRILLFYFLKKLGQYKQENPRIIERFNQIISEEIFLLRPRAAVPDIGYLTVMNEENSLMDISPGLILDCIVEDEQITRKYIITSSIIGHQLNLTQAYLAVPSRNGNRLCVTKQELPLKDTIYPFSPDVLCPVKNADHMFYPSIIITSKLLCMSEGVRNIELTMDMEDANLLELDRFKFKITTAEGWRTIMKEEVAITKLFNSDKKFVFNFKFNADYPPISPIKEVPDEEIYLKSKSAIMMGYAYRDKLSFSVKQVQLEVYVCGLRPMAIRNQEIILNPQDDYQPFGVDAELQSTFSFSHTELMHPKLREINLTPKWVGKPIDLNAYYKAYGKLEKDFKVNISTIYRAKDALAYTSHLDSEGAELMAETIAFKPTSLDETDNFCASFDIEEADPMNFNLYYQIQLVDQDFGQSQYPLLMSQYTIKYAKYENAKFPWLQIKPDEVNLPYIPIWSELLIDYYSEKVIWTSNPTGPTSPNQIIEVYKNEPKGYDQYFGEKINLGADQYGALYLGFEDLIKDGIGTLYFDGDTGNARAPQVTHTWWYLTNKKWEKLTDHILDDGTNGLTQTGIISWTIPEDISNSSTLMPAYIYWIKMTIEPILEDELHPQQCGMKVLEYYDAVMSLNGVFANACTISRQPEELAESNNVSPLAAGSTLTLQDTELDFEFDLPYNTYGQVKKESTLDFWARAFNRVRNRGRMVCVQDYEDLLLQDFRNLSVVKTIPRRKTKNYIDIVVINRQVYDTIPYPIPPLNSVKELNKIREAVFPFSTPFMSNTIELNVVNPCYQEVGFLVYLEFQGNATLPENELRVYEDLMAFVNPWRVIEDQPIQFGCWFDYAEIVSFLQSRPYIKAVYYIKMGLSDGETLIFPEKYTFSEEEVLIVTEPNKIVIVDNPDDYDWYSIGTMTIGKNFIVSDSSKEVMNEPKIENYE